MKKIDCWQLVHKFWIDSSTTSPNFKDVKHFHSRRPGDHKRVKLNNGKAFKVVCQTRRCQIHQKRYFQIKSKIIEKKFPKLEVGKNIYPSIVCN